MTALDHHLAGLDPWRRGLLLKAARGDRAARLFWFPERGMVNPDRWQAQVARETVTQRLDVLLNCSRQAGKTETLSYCNYLLASLGMFAVIVLPTDEQSKEFLRIVMEHHNRLHLTTLSKHRDPNMHEVNFSSGGRIIALPNSEKRVRMYRKVDQLTIDEASRVPDPIYNALRPVLMVGRGCTALASTPNGRSGFFYEEWIGEGSAADPRGGPWRRHRISWRDVGCHPDGTPRLRPQDLERERQRPGVIVEQEYLDCAVGEEFLAGGSCPFDSELWEAMVENNVWGDD